MVNGEWWAGGGKVGKLGGLGGSRGHAHSLQLVETEHGELATGPTRSHDVTGGR